MAKVSGSGKKVFIRSCDPGAGRRPVAPDAAIRRAATLLQIHNEVEVTLIDQFRETGLSVRDAECAALAIARSPELQVLVQIPEAELKPDQVSDAISASIPAVSEECDLTPTSSA